MLEHRLGRSRRKLLVTLNIDISQHHDGGIGHKRQAAKRAYYGVNSLKSLSCLHLNHVHIV